MIGVVIVGEEVEGELFARTADGSFVALFPFSSAAATLSLETSLSKYTMLYRRILHCPNISHKAFTKIRFWTSKFIWKEQKVSLSTNKLSKILVLHNTPHSYFHVNNICMPLAELLLRLSLNELRKLRTSLVIVCYNFSYTPFKRFYILQWEQFEQNVKLSSWNRNFKLTFSLKERSLYSKSRFFNIKASTGAIIAQGPPSVCPSALCSLVLK